MGRCSAMEAYAETRLKELSLTECFKLEYVELDEFEMVLGSMSVLYFCARYLCLVPLGDMPQGMWHLHWHDVASVHWQHAAMMLVLVDEASA
jgi:hypothetical protein